MAHRRGGRRRGLALALVVAIATAVACGSGDGADPRVTASSAPGSAEPEATAPSVAEPATHFPVMVSHRFGMTEVAAAPQRVMALGYTDLDDVLALGVKPIAARYPQFGSTDTAVRSWAEEAAAGARPEVLGLAFGELGLEARFASARLDHPEFAGRSLSTVFSSGDQLLAFASQDLRGRFFTDLGFAIPEAIDTAAGDTFFATLSIEAAEQVNTDVLVWSQLQFTDGGRGAIEADPSTVPTP